MWGRAATTRRLGVGTAQDAEPGGGCRVLAVLMERARARDAIGLRVEVAQLGGADRAPQLARARRGLAAHQHGHQRLGPGGAGATGRRAPSGRAHPQRQDLGGDGAALRRAQEAAVAGHSEGLGVGLGPADRGRRGAGHAAAGLAARDAGLSMGSTAARAVHGGGEIGGHEVAGGRLRRAGPEATRSTVAPPSSTSGPRRRAARPRRRSAGGVGPRRFVLRPDPRVHLVAPSDLRVRCGEAPERRAVKGSREAATATGSPGASSGPRGATKPSASAAPPVTMAGASKPGAIPAAPRPNSAMTSEVPSGPAPKDGAAAGVGDEEVTGRGRGDAPQELSRRPGGDGPARHPVGGGRLDGGRGGEEGRRADRDGGGRAWGHGRPRACWAEAGGGPRPPAAGDLAGP